MQTVKCSIIDKKQKKTVKLGIQVTLPLIGSARSRKKNQQQQQQQRIRNNVYRV